MENDLLIEHIVSNYNKTYDLSLMKIFSIKQYPHIYKLKGLGQTLFIKVIEKMKIYCENLNILYDRLKKNRYVKLPVLTNNGEYFTLYNNQILLMYEKSDEISDYPSPIWWSNCLTSVHQIEIDKSFKKYFNSNFYNQTINLYYNAKKYILSDRLNKIEEILKGINKKDFDKIKNIVLCHNDPYNLNVMKDSDGFKVIDTDGMGLSPREYDIQRLMINNVIDFNNINESLLFWRIFKDNYEKKAKVKIDVDLLKKLYKLDLVRMTSWLYVVSNDVTRKDMKRQKKRLKLYEKSFDNDNHFKFLERI